MGPTAQGSEPPPVPPGCPQPALGWGLARRGDGADGSGLTVPQFFHLFGNVLAARARRWEGRGTLCLGALKNSPDSELSRAAWGTLCLEGQRGHNPSGSPRARGYTPGCFDFSGTWVQDNTPFFPSTQACKELLTSTVQWLSAPALHPVASPATWNATQGQSAQLASTPCDVCDWERE